MIISRSRRLYSSLRTARNQAIRAVKGLRHVHPTTYIHPSCHVSRDLVTEEYVFMGNECWVGPMTRIGRYTLFGPRVAIVGDDHITDTVGVPMHFSGRPDQQTTHIGRDVWIGYGAIVRRGTTVGEGSIIGAGSVVTRNIPPYEIWAGVPARKVRDRFTSEQADLHSSALEEQRASVNFSQPQGEQA